MRPTKSISIQAANLYFITSPDFLDHYLLIRKNKIFVRPKNHRNPRKRTMERMAVVYKRILKYIGVRVLAAF